MIKVKNIIKKALNLDEKVNVRVVNILQTHDFVPMHHFEDQDVFIAGFPKSGNTWMQNLVTGILLDSTSYRITPKLVNEIVPDVHAKQFYKRTYPVMVFKTHDLPNKKFKRVIHLVRDGRDAMLSYYKMEVNRDENYENSLKDMVIEGKGVYPSKWHAHTRAWIENKYNAELITLKYEDLLNAPIDAMRQLCDFLNIEMSDKRLKAIYDANQISVLRQKVTQYGWDYLNEMNKDLVSFFVNESKEELQHFSYI